MVTRELIEHIQRAHAENKNPSAIRDELLESGWSEADIKNAMDPYKRRVLFQEKSSPVVIVERIITHPLKPWITAVVLAATFFIAAAVISL